MDPYQDDQTVADIYNRHVDTVYRVCYILLRNIPDTEDAVQTTFVKLLQSAKTFTDTDHERAWLITTARNYCKNVLSHWWRAKRSAWTEEAVEYYAATTEQDDELLAKVMELPAKYCLPLYLYYYERYTTTEIAKILEQKESTVRSQLYRGRERLRKSVLGGEKNETKYADD